MNIKIALVIIFILVLSALSVGIYLYNKPKAEMSSLKAHHIVSSVSLCKEYNENEAEANEKYIGKILEVKGRLLSVEDGEFAVLVLEGDEFSTVRAQMQAGYSAAGDLVGDPVNIKGYCTGLLLDVVLNDCVILNNEK